MAKFGVIGSINMDLVARVKSFPRPGETVLGQSFGTYPGGKGANQAIALARLGASVDMVGKLGDDLFADRYRTVFREENVTDELVEAEHAFSTGITMIEVDDTGENHIVYVPGANATCSNAFIDYALAKADKWDIVLVQLEIPLETTTHAARRLKEMGKTVVLDPAPAQTLPLDLLRSVDIITPNEHEASVLLSGAGPLSTGGGTAAKTAAALQRLGTPTVVVKLGGAGAYLKSEEQSKTVAGFAVDVVDTTAAGDAFNAGLAFALGEGSTLEEAVRFANAVGARSCTAPGAQGGFPTRTAAEGLIAEARAR